MLATIFLTASTVYSVRPVAVFVGTDITAVTGVTFNHGHIADNRSSGESRRSDGEGVVGISKEISLVVTSCITVYTTNAVRGIAGLEGEGATGWLVHGDNTITVATGLASSSVPVGVYGVIGIVRC